MAALPLDPLYLTDAQLERMVGELAFRLDRLATDLEACLDELENRGQPPLFIVPGPGKDYLADRAAENDAAGRIVS